MTEQKKKTTCQLDEVLLNNLEIIAEAEGRLLEAVLEEAVANYIRQKISDQPKASTIEHFQLSLEKNRKLGELLSE